MKNTNGTVRLIAVLMTLFIVSSTAVYTVAEVATKVGGLERRMTTRERRDETVASDIAEIKGNVKLLLERTEK